MRKNFLVSLAACTMLAGGAAMAQTSGTSPSGTTDPNTVTTPGSPSTTPPSGTTGTPGSMTTTPGLATTTPADRRSATTGTASPADPARLEGDGTRRARSDRN